MIELKSCSICQKLVDTITLVDWECGECRKEARRTELKKSLPKNAKDKLTLDDYKVERNRLLAESDWTQMPDAENRVGGKEMVKAWAEYRSKVHKVISDYEKGKRKTVRFPKPPAKEET